MSGPANPGDRRSAAGRTRLPLLARLCEAETGPGVREEAFVSTSDALDALRTAVRRDVECLLNARRRRLPLPPHLKELQTSLLSYGIPDPISGAFSVPALRDDLLVEIERTLERFEPRLAEIAVTMVEDRGDMSNLMRMRVNAVLRADPLPEAVSFETRLDTVSRDITVREA
jgi:type VI secretion system protein ImpF